MNDREIVESVQSITNTKEPERKKDEDVVEEGKPTVVDGVIVNVHGIPDMSVGEARNYIKYVLDGIRKNIESSLKKVTVTRREDGQLDLDWELQPQKFERIRRITGYLVGDVNRWNDAKRAEEHERTKHAGGPGFRRFVQMAREAYDSAMENQESKDSVYVQQTFLSLCHERNLDPVATAASLLARTMDERWMEEPSKSSFEEDFLSVCRHHNVSPRDAAKAIERNLAKLSQKVGGR